MFAFRGVFSAVTVLVLCCLILVDGKPVRERRSLPPNWKDLLTPEVYEYHLNKGHSKHAFEGDIAGIDRDTTDQASAYRLRNANVYRSQRWPSGIVPYEISESFTPNEKNIIEQAVRDMMQKTCVYFVPYVSQTDYISFVRSRTECSSYVARTGGKQLIVLQPGCISQIGEVQHEVMHALGFYHEQSRMDRDDHVTIIWSNVLAGAEDQFKKYQSDNLNMPYDYESIMHYGWNYFAKDQSKPTILPKVGPHALGTRVVMSQSDVEKINRLYECPGTNLGAGSASPTTVRPRTRAPTTTTRRGQTHRHPSHTTGNFTWTDFQPAVKKRISEELKLP